eukprot:TRINITY_DN13013_c1_g1_i1.p1 TRINITY_DN13013_c1_g1~~TRINITY_DN13013_c1_g1_i1.p1  ORF type:complete len:582 (+),score=126.56 TRINITY_DN13013_c1_g1_i1:33-1778(+)
MADQESGVVAVPQTTGRQVWAKDEGAPWWPAKVVESGYVMPHEIPEGKDTLVYYYQSYNVSWVVIENPEEIMELTREQLENEEESRVAEAGEWAEDLRFAIREAKTDLDTGLKMQLSLKTCPDAELRKLQTPEDFAEFSEFQFDNEDNEVIVAAAATDDAKNDKKEKKRLKKEKKEQKKKEKELKKKAKDEKSKKRDEKARDKEEKAKAKEEQRLNAKKKRDVEKADETRAIKKGREELMREEECRKRAIKTETLEVFHEELATAIELNYLSKQREILSKLAYVQPTLHQLKEVGIGKTVVKLINSPLQPLAKCIVQFWKSYLPEVQPLPRDYTVIPEAEKIPQVEATEESEEPKSQEPVSQEASTVGEDNVVNEGEGVEIDGEAPTADAAVPGSQSTENLVSLNHEGRVGDYRSNMLRKIVDALSTPSPEGKVVEMIHSEPHSVNQIAGAIVNQLEITFPDDHERQLKKLKQIVTNLQDPKNAEFRELVLYKPSPYDLVKTMTAADMANPEIRRERQETTAYETEAMRLDYNKPAITRQFKCGRCKQNKTVYTQLQTRSADEPMTTFVNCVNCGNAWKFC